MPVAFMIPVADPEYFNTAGKRIHVTVLYIPGPVSNSDRHRIVNLMKQRALEWYGTTQLTMK